MSFLSNQTESARVEKRRDLVKSVFGGVAREAADEDGAVRVSDDLGIAEGVICKKSEK